MDLELVDWYEVLDITMNQQYEVFSRDNWQPLDKVDSKLKTFMLDSMLRYYTKIEDYEKCIEINKQILNQNK